MFIVAVIQDDQSNCFKHKSISTNLQNHKRGILDTALGPKFTFDFRKQKQGHPPLDSHCSCAPVA